MEWQPIETAPKGQNIIICCAGKSLSIWIAYDAGQRKRIWFHKGSKKKMFMEPTHWMPLPEAPN